MFAGLRAVTGDDSGIPDAATKLHAMSLDPTVLASLLISELGFVVAVTQLMLGGRHRGAFDGDSAVG